PIDRYRESALHSRFFALGSPAPLASEPAESPAETRPLGSKLPEDQAKQPRQRSADLLQMVCSHPDPSGDSVAASAFRPGPPVSAVHIPLGQAALVRLTSPREAPLAGPHLAWCSGRVRAGTLE